MEEPEVYSKSTNSLYYQYDSYIPCKYKISWSHSMFYLTKKIGSILVCILTIKAIFLGSTIFLKPVFCSTGQRKSAQIYYEQIRFPFTNFSLCFQWHNIVICKHITKIHKLKFNVIFINHLIMLSRIIDLNFFILFEQNQLD